jgi:UDP-N-acetylmuramoyl-tripeptide--D-alanyl-D-alanine ligase
MQIEKLYNLFKHTTGVCTDTRAIKKDSFFISLKGSNFNGNEFAQNAIKEGAKYAIVDEKSYANNETIFLVDDCLKALQDLANYHRKQFNIPVIGITGSNGKTTSKELINIVLHKKYNTLATKGNLNNHIGVPLTLLEMNSTHEIAIIEMGANKPGDIKELAEIAEPNFGIITNIGKAHLEGFINYEGVINTKTELFRFIQKNKDGVLFYNEDDEIIKNNLPIEISWASYGKKNESTIKGELIKLSPYVEMKWEKENYISPILKNQMIGEYNFYNYLAAICIGNYFNVSEDLINQAVEEYKPTNNRSQIKKTDKNTLILDCYNANPTSMKSAIDSFHMNQASDKIAIIGDMLELGNESKIEHQKIIGLLNEYKINYITVGPIFETIEHSKPKFKNTSELIENIKAKNIEIMNSLVLLKGSRGIGLEKLEEVL